MIQTAARLIKKEFLVADVVLLTFSTSEPLVFTPGQYAILTIPTLPSPVKRLYSFAGPRISDNTFELLVRLVEGGVASTYLKNMEVGASIPVSGPAGLFKEQPSEARKIYMVTGTGFAPVRSFLQSRPAPTVNALLFWGMKNHTESYLIEELRAIEKAAPSFSFFYCLSQEEVEGIPAEYQKYYRTGHIDAVYDASNISKNPLDEYYLCGSRTVVESLRSHLAESGISKEKIFFEKY